MSIQNCRISWPIVVDQRVLPSFDDDVMSMLLLLMAFSLLLLLLLLMALVSSSTTIHHICTHRPSVAWTQATEFVFSTTIRSHFYFRTNTLNRMGSRWSVDLDRGPTVACDVCWLVSLVKFSQSSIWSFCSAAICVHIVSSTLPDYGFCTPNTKFSVWIDHAGAAYYSNAIDSIRNRDIDHDATAYVCRKIINLHGNSRDWCVSSHASSPQQPPLQQQQPQPQWHSWWMWQWYLCQWETLWQHSMYPVSMVSFHIQPPFA